VHLNPVAIDNIARSARGKTIHLGGGETTLHPELFDIVKKLASSSPQLIKIFTNGKSFTESPQQARDFMKRLRSAAGGFKGIKLVMAVDDNHAPFCGEVSLKERARIMREAAEAEGIDYKYFTHSDKPGEDVYAVAERYGLPARFIDKQKISFDQWLSPKKELGIQAHRYVINVGANGRVYASPGDLLRRNKDYGSLSDEPFDEITARIPQRPLRTR
jgi:MoaA/NifB/PqqE/SkfB family radical SAM enzyme